MADTTIRECKQCGNDFDSIYQLDLGYCDDCGVPEEKKILIKTPLSMKEFLDKLRKIGVEYEYINCQEFIVWVKEQ